MTIRQAFRRGWQAWRTQGTCWLSCTLSALCVTGMSLAPLLLAAAPPVRGWALLCVPLFLLLVLPLRQGLAALMGRAVRGERTTPVELLAAPYGTSLGRGLKTALCLLLWGSPALAATIWLAAQYKGAQDVFSLMRLAGTLGGGVAVDGMLAAVPLYLLTFLPLLVGLAFHSGSRFAAAAGCSLRGRRGGMLLCWLCSQVTLLPFAVVAALLTADVVPQIAAAIAARSLAMLPDFGRLGLWLLADAAVLLLPALPLRALIQAAWVCGEAAA